MRCPLTTDLDWTTISNGQHSHRKPTPSSSSSSSRASTCLHDRFTARQSLGMGVFQPTLLGADADTDF
jgi:hypothetical protein